MAYNKPRTGEKKKRWSIKYKKSINCSNPKGFSQINYCKRKKRGGGYKNESLMNLFLESVKEMYIYDEKVGDYQYKGFSAEQEKDIFYKITMAFEERKKVDFKLNSLPNYVKYIENIYTKLISNNPELKNIRASVSGYNTSTFPKHDIVFGALSGIPPEDIKYYVETTKGKGGMYKGKNKLDLDQEKSYISPLKNK